MASDEELRRRVVRKAVGRLRSGRPLVSEMTDEAAPRLVRPEDPAVDSVEVSTGAQIRRRVHTEAELVRRFRLWLDPGGSRLRAWAIPVDGEVLRTDLYDTKTGVLIEAKAAATRDLLRQAIGQLIDYRRYLSPRPQLAVLLPERPISDLEALIGELEIATIWYASNGFHDSVGGELVRR
jgi:hypothetical protein